MAAIGTQVIQKTLGVCGGDACIRNTRIPVWMLVLNRQLGMTDSEILGSLSRLAQSDLDAAWDYYREHPVEIEQSIWLNDTAVNVPSGMRAPAAVIIAGQLLGLDETAVSAAFDPPLTRGDIVAAWDEYRADPRRIGRDLASLRRAG